MSYKPSKCPDCKSDVQMCCCQAWEKTYQQDLRINKEFDNWYDTFERDGGELLLFNTPIFMKLDLQEAFKEGYIQAMTDYTKGLEGVRDENNIE